MRVRIYQPARTAMQSGKAKSAEWVLEYPRQDKAVPDALMGWQSSADTLKTVHLHFDTSADAIAYAEANGMEYVLLRTGQRRQKLRAYADNFAFGKRQAWTH
ncbi:ETC complex I subunit [Alphaproteobacteria bacterium LSUCC0684]